MYSTPKYCKSFFIFEKYNHICTYLAYTYNLLLLICGDKVLQAKYQHTSIFIGIHSRVQNKGYVMQL